MCVCVCVCVWLSIANGVQSTIPLHSRQSTHKHTSSPPYPPPKATSSTTTQKIHRYSDTFSKGGTWMTFAHERACVPTHINITLTLTLTLSPLTTLTLAHI